MILGCPLKIIKVYHCISPTARQEGLPVHLDSAFPPKLLAGEVGVVGGVDVVVGEGLVHLLVGRWLDN